MQTVLKRSLDIVISAFLIVVSLPFSLLIGALIRKTSPGPVFFVQERPGLNGVLFRIYKFRTMKQGSERMVKGQEVMPDDDRITLIGKFLRRSKLDELPQAINVLKGEMSLVGPRPERIASLAEYDKETAIRLTMRPGMTGLAQVSGNIHLSLKDRYRLDVYYVKHFSLKLDFLIILRTVGVVFLGEDHYVNKPLVRLSLTSQKAGQEDEEDIDNR